ncbi:MAG TPA: ribose ABC transporter permease, partial [Enterobacteriaceae bacterium]|nr:ribose ABC transporter permease [Enterobacteriaceae bacterium]
NMNGVSFFVQQIIIGSVILLAVAYDQIRQRPATKKSVKQKVSNKKPQVTPSVK